MEQPEEGGKKKKENPRKLILSFALTKITRGGEESGKQFRPPSLQIFSRVVEIRKVAPPPSLYLPFPAGVGGKNEEEEEEGKEIFWKWPKRRAKKRSMSRFPFGPFPSSSERATIGVSPRMDF